MTPAPKTRREQADQAFVRSLGDISSPDQDDLDLIACERIKWHEAVQWADSTPAPSEQGDEEADQIAGYEYAAKRLPLALSKENENVHWSDEFCMAFCAGITHSRRTQAAEIERLKDEQSKILCAATGGKFSKLSNIESMLGAIRQEFEDIDDEYSEKINELRALLERAMKAWNGDATGEEMLKLISDYAKLTSNAAQGGEG